MADKSELVPFDQFRIREGHEQSNFTFAGMRLGGPELMVPFDVVLPWPVTVTILNQADKSDPTNQLIVYGVMVGDFGFKLTLTCVGGSHLEPDLDRVMMAVMLMAGVDNSAEIKGAIASARDKFQADR